MTGTRKDVMMSVAMGVLVLFALYYFLVRPQQGQLASARAERQDLEQVLAATEEQLSTTASTVPLDPGAGSVVDEVPAEPGLADMLRQLQLVGEETGVVQQSVSPGSLGANPSGPGGSLQITIAATGPHPAVVAYMQRIRDLERLVVVEQVGIERSGGDDRVQLVLRVFTQRAAVDAVAAP